MDLTIYDIIKGPVISDKAILANRKHKKLVFKVHQDATAEDLVKKMPGITSDNNGIKVNGETVTKVMVDGKVFFGEYAVRYLPKFKMTPNQISTPSCFRFR